ncbi:tryptophan synthase beta subunit-like PLP-dependent enzyme [Auriscalpium vulgare]|uniref:Tryptophan synthase beta subunit-like PLP-dependent enzyme n=1 Tax=Auriscalpium vulgare TaxID=40419 RepID=A0ACB8S1J8_9AGAM|nr:tryptophan synthase beta subunit-like PLP-dependent enzyme [Auriscalpium vulgare]
MSTVTPPDAPKLWLETPLIYSSHLSDRLGPDFSVYLKLDNLQPAHSFKYRGLSLFVQRHRAIRGPSLHIVCASGGNAGLAAACASQAVGVKCTVFLPEGVSESTKSYLQKMGAELVVAGKFYMEAVRAAKAVVDREENAVLAPAYESPILWEGHASMVEEIKTQLPRSVKPEAIFCDVGGAGLLGGLILGCKDSGWEDVSIIAAETHGSNCFYHSILANRSPSYAPPDGITVRHDTVNDVNIAHVHNLTSLATSLGASEPAAEVVKMALGREGSVKVVSIPDELAMHTARAFADHHKLLVELACATALAPAYKQSLIPHILRSRESVGEKRVLVFVVCGGFKVSLEELALYERLAAQDLAAGGKWDILIDGECQTVEKGI